MTSIGLVTFRAKWVWAQSGLDLALLSQSAGRYITQRSTLFSSTPPLFSCGSLQVDTRTDQIARSSRRPYHVRPSSYPVDALGVISLGSIIDFDPGSDHHQLYLCRLFSTRSNISICIGIGISIVRGNLPSRLTRQLGPADNAHSIDYAGIFRSYFKYFGCTGSYGHSGCPDGGGGGGCGPLCA